MGLRRHEKQTGKDTGRVIISSHTLLTMMEESIYMKGRETCNRQHQHKPRWGMFTWDQ